MTGVDGSRPATELQTRKAGLRRSMVERIRSLPLEVSARSADRAAESLSRFLGHNLAHGSVVAFYYATPTELRSAPAARLLAEHWSLAYPRISDRALRFHLADHDALTPHSSKVYEPLPADPEVTPDAIVLPGRAFDTFGVRLGHGAGYYDATLATLDPTPLLIGYCYAFQVVDELPRDPHDRWVHWLVTDEGEPHRCKPLPTTTRDPAPVSHPDFTGAVAHHGPPAP
jgi:5-formyltetrahydrofolate cyclo-ligase